MKCNLRIFVNEALGYRVLSTVKVLNLFKKGDVLESQNAIYQVKMAGKKLEETYTLRKEIENEFK
ncbi:hypothetical protein [Clostridium sp.]